MMVARLLTVSLGFVVLTCASALAGRLDIAIIQYTDARDQAAIEAALQNVDLFEITDSDKVESSERAIKGGKVLFVQTLSMGSQGAIANSTRLGNVRCDVQGSLSGNKLNVQVVIQDGVDVGLRKFSRREFSGSGSVAGGKPQIIGIKQSTGKTQSVVKGQSKIVSYDATSMMVAQFRP